MDDIQTIKFPSTNSSIVCHNVEDLGASVGALTMNSQTNSYSVSNFETIVKLESTTHTSGSSAVATRHITNYPWDLVYIPGNLVAVHSSGNFIAYAIKDPKFPIGMMRIISRRTGLRGLIKNIPGLIRDMAFAYLSSRIMLAFIDQHGTLFVYEIVEEETKLGTTLLVEIKRSEDEESSDYQRVIWCPFIPDEPDDEDEEEADEENFAYLLVVTNGPLAEIWHIMTLIQLYGAGPINRSLVSPGQGHQVMEKHLAPISDAAFSPDGTALATASLDGHVKFFQVYMADNQKSPRCLHQWKPHDGKPLSSLFFLDNHKNPSPDVQFWKYAVTGACNNTEIKAWSCETWQCTQVVKFEHVDKANPENKISLKAAIDPSSKYLILSDIHRRVLYVFIICQEPQSEEGLSNGDSLDTSSHGASKGGVARIISISEFPIQYSTMFLTITDADWKPYKRWKHEQLGRDTFQEDAADDSDDEEDNGNVDIVEGLVIKCVLINTKSLQDATIRFQPALPSQSNFDRLRLGSSGGDKLILNATQSSVALKDGLTDLSLNLSSSLSEMDSSGQVGGNLASRKASEALDKSSLLPIFPSFNSVSNTMPSSDVATNITSSVSTSAAISSLACGISEGIPVSSFTSPILTSHGTSIATSLDCTISSQPVTMNLLTPESFSSPGKVEEEDLLKKEEINQGSEGTKEIFSKNTPPPPEDLKSAAFNLLRVNSGSGLQSSETTSPSVTRSSLSPHNAERVTKNILETAVSGSSRSPPMNMLPPPPTSGSSPLPNNEDRPLATSEMSHRPTSAPSPPLPEPSSNLMSGSTVAEDVPVSLPHVGSGIGLASSTSSPSLEVQQILYSHNSKPEDVFPDEEEESLKDQSIKVNGTKPRKTEVVPCQSLQELINITSASKIGEAAAVKAPSQSPLIDMFSGFKNLPTPATSQLTHLMESGPTQSSPLSVTTVTNVFRIPDVPTSNRSYAPKETSPSLPPLLKGKTSFGKNHLTCEQLEAKIKASSPTQKPQNNDAPSPSCSSASLSTLIFPSSLESRPEVSPSTNVHSESQKNDSLERETARYDKTLEEIESLRKLIVSCDTDHEERTRTLTNQIDKSLKSLHQQNKQIEDLKKSFNKLHDQLPNLITSSAKPIIECCIRQEIKNGLTPSLNKCLEPIRSQLRSEIRTLVENSEVHITESLTRDACSRVFIDNLSSAVASALSVSIQSACRDAYNKVVVPGFNAITQQVFIQLNEAFTRGTKEYMQHVENESQTTRNALLDNVSSNSRTLEATSATLSAHVTTIADALHKCIAQQNTFSDSISDRLRQLVHDEVGRALQEHQASVEARTSRAQTPLPSASSVAPANPKIARQQLQQLISQGQFNVAFKQALSASDLSLVVFLCERINHQHLFSQTPCPLSQDVLLSLINQLSHDLTTFTDLKTKYLEEALMSLDSTHPITVEHMREVLQKFQRSLSLHLEKNPNHKKLKMLLHVVNHLIST